MNILKVRKDVYWDLLSTGLVLGVLMISAYRLQLTNWAVDLDRVGNLVFYGYLLGIILGLSPLGYILSLFSGFVLSGFFFSWQLVASPDPDTALIENLAIFGFRVLDALMDFINNRPVYDTVLFLTVMALLYWFASFFAGFNLIRMGNPWFSIFISSFAYILISYYDVYQQNVDLYTIVLFLFVLLILGRLNFLKSRQVWKSAGIKIEYETSFSHIRTTVLIALLMLLLAWNVPILYDLFSAGSNAQENLILTWENLQEKFSNAVIALEYPDYRTSDYYRGGMSLGTRAITGNQPVFEAMVRTSNVEKLRFYWYGHSFDTYENGRWSNSSDVVQKIQSQDWPVYDPQWISRQEAEFSFLVRAPLLYTFYYPGFPLLINRPGEIVRDRQFDNDFDLKAILPRPSLRSGDQYQVLSLISSKPTAAQLRTAGEDYPPGILDKYLQVPGNLPDRLNVLAKGLTAGETNTYDKATVVTKYLRDTIDYSDRIPGIPAGREPLDWVLFDLQEGFCNYYASIEVMMLRSLGIPSRLVVGYAEGTAPGERNEYLVRKNDSHAWPEVFFPGYGWLEFEPTTSQPALIYPSGLALIMDNPFQNIEPSELSRSDFELDRFEEDIGIYSFPDDQPLEDISRSRFGWLIAVTLIIVIFGGSYLVITSKMTNPPIYYVEGVFTLLGLPVPKWLKYLLVSQELQDAEKNYFKLMWLIKIFGFLKFKEGITPQERIGLLVSEYPGLSSYGWAILDGYQNSIYNESEPDGEYTNDAFREISRYLILNWIRKLFGPGKY